ncbi:M20 family metallopeptidase [Candidatus Nanohalobium constans]|uniref:Succinyl-diaminopimelate desuccinylase n=1 Tax=Candidatus Nanohalobium constans TaxID=2565781 RepID=A0A5Q0UGL2_9ARCH|nr:M20/M25/M40 family metallo-hydrolase [Candidatus Nanohalobium constans]QGA80095.1 succinyl-diaminopimelate desuccinylase [Candidatus Nanohalobium constans]
MKQPEELTKDLIKFQTIEGNTEEVEKCLDYIENQFSTGFKFEQFEKEGEKSLLISRGENPRILLHGHIDVVGADEEMFEPEVKEGRIHGRGAADMKSGVACMMKVLNEGEKEGVALLLTSDEERGGFNGTGHVIEEKDLNPDIVISAEPDDSGNFPSIVTEQKGVLQLEITIEGESAHASKPEKGENAAEKLMTKYAEIKNLFDSKKDFPTTLNLGNIAVEGPVNKVPSSASMQLDIRFSASYPKEEVLKDIKQISGIDTEVMAEAPMMQNSRDDKMIRRLMAAAEKASGEQADLRKENFASDMRFFTEKDIPAVCFGPEGYKLHSKDEYVETESLKTYCEILKTFLNNGLSR